MKTTVETSQRVELIEWKDGAPIMQCINHRWSKPIHVTRLLAGGDSNVKLAKNSDIEYLTAGHSILPSTFAGVGNVCAGASRACIDACLNETGMGAIIPLVNASRMVKTWLWYNEREWYIDTLATDIDRWERKARKDGKRLACRLNVFSDIPWEHFGIIDRFPTVQFYDYSKVLKRGRGMKNPSLIRPNYWVTYSRSETNEAACLELLSRGANVAVVFHNPGAYCGNRSGAQVLPKLWNGFKVIDGDKTDLRFTDIRGRKFGRVIGLKLKSANNEKRNAAIKSGFSVEHRPN